MCIPRDVLPQMQDLHLMPPRKELLIDRLLPLAIRSRQEWAKGGMRFLPNEVFNTRWLLRALLDAFEYYRLDGSGALDITPDSGWMSDVTLESPFAYRYPGDHLGERFPTVSAVIGSFIPPAKPGEPLRLKPDCRTFTVIDAYLHDMPPDGIPGFPWYTRFAQLAACMAQTVMSSGIDPGSNLRSNLVVMVPHALINNTEAIRQMLHPLLVRGLVSSRVNCYREEDEQCINERYDWLHNCFLRYFRKLQMFDYDLAAATTDSGRFQEMSWFYSGCLCFNRPEGLRAGRSFSASPRTAPRARRDRKRIG